VSIAELLAEVQNGNVTQNEFFDEALPLLKAAGSALHRAVRECAKHNAEYHHVTPEPLLAEWEGLLGTGAKPQPLPPKPIEGHLVAFDISGNGRGAFEARLTILGEAELPLALPFAAGQRVTIHRAPKDGS